MTTPVKLSAPLAAEKPARGMMTSEGIGGKTFSSSMSSAMPAYPVFSIRLTIKSNTLLHQFWRDEDIGTRTRAALGNDFVALRFHLDPWPRLPSWHRIAFRILIACSFWKKRRAGRNFSSPRQPNGCPETQSYAQGRIAGASPRLIVHRS